MNKWRKGLPDAEGQALSPPAVEEILMTPNDLVREEGTGLCRWEQTDGEKNGIQPQQATWSWAVTMKVVLHSMRFPGRDTIPYSSLLKAPF